MAGLSAIAATRLRGVTVSIRLRSGATLLDRRRSGSLRPGTEMFGQFRIGLLVGRGSARASGGSPVASFRDAGSQVDDRRGPDLEAKPLAPKCLGEPESIEDDCSDGELESSAKASALPETVAIAVPTPTATAAAQIRPVASILAAPRPYLRHCQITRTRGEWLQHQ
jgi:hypothetical protein